MTEKQNLENIVETSAKALIKAADPTLKEIKDRVNKIQNTLKAFDHLHEKVYYYNEAVERITHIQNLAKSSKAKGFSFNSFPLKISPDTLEGQEILSLAQREEEEIQKKRFERYQEEGLNKDIQYINKFQEYLTKLSKKGYKQITDFRKRLTKQEIIYAVQGHGGKEYVYTQYLTEEDFLELLISRPQKTSNVPLLKIGEKASSFTNAYLSVSFEKLTNGEKIKASISSPGVGEERDPLYRAIYSFVKQKGSNKEGFSVSEAWEAYTEARGIFNKRQTMPSETEILDFIESWKKQKSAVYKNYDTSDNKSTENYKEVSFSRLKFYQGGDSTTFNESVVIQNKSSTSNMEASVRIPTIYNGLKNIVEVFGGVLKGEKISLDSAKKLFTAEMDDNTTKNYIMGTFNSANNFARGHLEEVLNTINREITIRKK